MQDQSDFLKTRIKQLRRAEKPGKCVLYVMSRDQRIDDNHALLAAQKHALAKGLPLAVVFVLLEKTGYRAREHFSFMLEGLREVEARLDSLSIPFMMVIGDPYDRLSAVLYHTDPDAVYFDFSPLRGSRALQKRLCSDRTYAMYTVDTHNIVPVWIASDKQEVGAYTIRPKIHKQLGNYLDEPDQLIVHPYAWPGTIQKLANLQDRIDEVLDKIPNNGTKIAVPAGARAASAHLSNFVKNKLATYAVSRNDPSAGNQSDLSPYLHLGQISSLRVALELRKVALENGSDLHFLSSPKMPKPEDAQTTLQHGIDALIEELVVRKELADNYCYYNENYDSLAAAPAWARVSLDKHRDDPREFLYSYAQLRDAMTHDEAWNAAQRQLTTTGKMHGYMRMYWAKKVLEWTESPEQAIIFLIQLNDHYSIDGGDPNGYAGILWSVAGVHDRPWSERPVFGVIRYMNYAGLKRKFDIQSYEKQFGTSATLNI